MYLDPPYFKGGEVYENMSGREEGASWGMTDFYDLREQLTNLKNAHFVLSIDQADFWLETMPNLHVTPVERVNAASFCVGGEKKRDIEYVIRNFNPEEVKTMDYYSKKNKIADDMEI